jgi:hypothetical protein
LGGHQRAQRSTIGRVVGYVLIAAWADVAEVSFEEQVASVMVRPVWKRSRAKPLVLRAVEIVVTFGPERRRPEDLRLREAVPGAAPDDVAEAIRQAHDIERRAYELTEPCWGGGAMLPDPEFKRLTGEATARLADEFPFLPKRAVPHLVSQAHYFHSR